MSDDPYKWMFHDKRGLYDKNEEFRFRVPKAKTLAPDYQFGQLKELYSGDDYLAHIKAYAKDAIEAEAAAWFLDPANEARVMPDHLRGTRAYDHLFGLKPETPKAKANQDEPGWEERLDRLTDEKHELRRKLDHELLFTQSLKKEHYELKTKIASLEEKARTAEGLAGSLNRMESDLGKVERAIGSIRFKEITENK